VIPSGSTSSACRRWCWVAGGRRPGGTHGLGTVSVEGVAGGWGIDREHHSTRTMATLSTVNPHRCGVVHANGESGECGSISPNGLAVRRQSQTEAMQYLDERYLQTRIEAVHHRTARAGKGGLSGRMILLVELESDSVSWLGSNVAGRERENTSTTHDDTVVRTSGGG
jgi:hypothetical protein